jgi:peptide/nickel transport system substrate-binding protein
VARAGSRQRTGSRAVVGLVAVAALTLSACGGGSDDEAADTSGGGQAITDLVVDVQNEPDSLDPFYRNNEMAQRFYRLTYSALLSTNEDGTFSPDLAAELPEVSDDRKTYRITLRDDVTFHDGSSFDAEDVVFTYEQAAAEENGAVWRSALGFMESIEAEDEHTVVLRLSEPYAFMESRLALIPILSSEEPYATNDTYAQRENGTGPYQLEELARGSKIVLARYDGYHGETPPFETITFALVPEDSSRIARLTNGDTHLVPELPLNQIQNVKERGQNAEAIAGNISRIYMYTSQLETRPTSNTDFRLALAWALDRQAIIDNVYAGNARPNSTYLTYGTLYHDEELGLHFGSKPDLDKARSHLEAAGGAPDRPLEMIVFDRPDLRNVATIVQANLAELGIESEVTIADVAGFFGPLVSGEYDVLLYNSPATTSSGLAPDYVNGGLNSTSANNFSKFSDPEMDQLLHHAITAPEAEQAEAWKAVQQRDVETQGHIQIVAAQNAMAWSTDLTGFVPSKFLWFNTLLDVENGD